MLWLMACLHPSFHLIFSGDLSCNWIVSFADPVIAVSLCSQSSSISCWSAIFFHLLYIYVLYCLRFIGFCRFDLFHFWNCRTFSLYIINNFCLIITFWRKWLESLLGPPMDLIFWLTSFLLAFTNEWSIWFRVVLSRDIQVASYIYVGIGYLLLPYYLQKQIT